MKVRQLSVEASTVRAPAQAPLELPTWPGWKRLKFYDTATLGSCEAPKDDGACRDANLPEGEASSSRMLTGSSSYRPLALAEAAQGGGK